MTKHTRGKFTVIVVKTQDTGDGIYIGRPMSGQKGSVLENPYRVKDESQRGTTLVAYKSHLKEIYVVKDSPAKAECQRLADILESEGTITLRCWCAPKKCHGDVIAQVLFRILEKRGHDVPKGVPESDSAPITEFKGKYAFLSNMYKCNLTIDGEKYNSSEAFCQAMKTLDLEERELLLALGSPYAMKSASRVPGTLTIRDDWDEVKVGFMRVALSAKFSSPKLREMLLETGDRKLVEQNHWHDNFWGCCTCDKHVYTLGGNVLGFLLWELRRKLRKV